MTRNADVVIIGGGIIGLAVAFNLAKFKFGKIVVFEKEMFLGSGATSKCAGGIRAQFFSKSNIEMSMKSEEILANFEEITGYPAIFNQCGYMFLLSDENELNNFSKAVELQKSLGLPVELIDPDRINELAPGVKTDDIIKATYCPQDGLADPNDLIQGYASASRKLGVEILIETEVTGIKTVNDSITGISTNKGDIDCPLIVNAAGPYAKVIAQMAGTSIPVEAVRRQIVTTAALDFIGPDFPMVVDVKAGLYFHREAPGLLLGWADSSVQPAFDESVDPDYTDEIIMKALDRIPALETAGVSNSWAGLYEITPDHISIIGPSKKVNGLFYINGFSGHGLMHAPAAGLVAAEAICGKETTVDITPLAEDRFENGVISEETNVI